MTHDKVTSAHISVTSDYFSDMVQSDAHFSKGVLLGRGHQSGPRSLHRDHQSHIENSLCITIHVFYYPPLHKIVHIPRVMNNVCIIEHSAQNTVCNIDIIMETTAHSVRINMIEIYVEMIIIL